jgi:hypothetical protein
METVFAITSGGAVDSDPPHWIEDLLLAVSVFATNGVRL